MLDGLGQFFDVETAGGGVDDVLVDTALAVEFVGVAALLYAPLLEGVHHLAVDDLGDGMGDDDDGAVLLDGVDGGLDLLRGDGVQRGRRWRT